MNLKIANCSALQLATTLPSAMTEQIIISPRLLSWKPNEPDFNLEIREEYVVVQIPSSKNN